MEMYMPIRKRSSCWENRCNISISNLPGLRYFPKWGDRRSKYFTWSFFFRKHVQSISLNHHQVPVSQVRIHHYNVIRGSGCIIFNPRVSSCPMSMIPSLHLNFAWPHSSHIIIQYNAVRGKWLYVSNYLITALPCSLFRIVVICIR